MEPERTNFDSDSLAAIVKSLRKVPRGKSQVWIEDPYLRLFEDFPQSYVYIFYEDELTLYVGQSGRDYGKPNRNGARIIEHLRGANGLMRSPDGLGWRTTDEVILRIREDEIELLVFPMAIGRLALEAWLQSHLNPLQKTLQSCKDRESR
jgi:hypothetical protein